MEIVYFTVAGIFLYFFSDWVLEQIEAMFGRRLEYRSLIFFAIILVLSMSLFKAVQYFQTGETTNPPEKEVIGEPADRKAQDAR